MRTFRNTLLAGIAAAAIGVAGGAFAQSGDYHLMTVRFPNGGLAQIRYTGDVAPQVTFGEVPGREAPAATELFARMPSFFGPGSPFAAMEQISNEIDRETATMFRQADTLAAEAKTGQLTEAALRSLPAGSQSYTFVSTMSGNGSHNVVCSQSVEITGMGNGRPPRVVRQNSGNCGPIGGTAGSVNLPTASPQFGQPGPVWTSAPMPRALPSSRSDVVWTSANGAKPYAGLVHELPAASR